MADMEKFAGFPLAINSRLGSLINGLRERKVAAEKEVTESDNILEVIKELFESIDVLLAKLETSADTVDNEVEEFRAEIKTQRSRVAALIGEAVA